MAFTAAQKQAIRNYLGAPAVYRDMQHRLEGALDVVGNDAQAAVFVTDWLTRLADIDDRLTGDTASTASSVVRGALKKVDEVEFYPVSGDDGSASAPSSLTLIQQGRTLIKRIARILGVADVFPMGDYFGSQRSASCEPSLG